MDRNLKIGVIGLGLIGGSIFKGLCALKCNVYAASSSIKTIKKAKKYTKNASKSLLPLKCCDIIFVCTPMNKTIEILDKLESILSPNTIVTDVCSLKRFLCNKKRSYKFIPSHPMAGTEFTGFDNSFEALFQNAKWVLTPLKGTKNNDIKQLTDVIKVLGATPILSKPKDHDKAVALISHMPMLIAQALFKTAQGNSLALKIAANGFKDMTRLAMSNDEMANDMINLNSDNIQFSLLKLYSSIGELLDKDYRSKIRKLRRRRQMIYTDGKK